MKAKYIIRLDDACDTSNLAKWNKIEEILDNFGISPIVAVIPDNKDQTLNHDPSNPAFWKMVKRWEEKGWSIAMHGYQHTFHVVNRKRLVFPYYDRSEFGGLSLEEQKNKIRSSLKIFRKNKIEPRLWVAPAHSFDEMTLRALADETQINVVSDGISFATFYRNGFYFIPQQLWSIKKKRFGIWTVCLHPDTMMDEDFDKFRLDLSNESVRNNMVQVDDIELIKKGKSILGYLFSGYFWSRYRLVSLLKGR